MAFIPGGLLERINEICGEGLPLKFDVTPEGGYAVPMINKTGAASVKGTLVEVYDATAIDYAVDIAVADALDCIGAIYDDGVADGSEVWVVCGGFADVLLKDSTASTRHYWVKVSDVAGRADATNANPPGGLIGQLFEHFGEIGHAVQTVSSGTDVLARVMLHFL